MSADQPSPNQDPTSEQDAYEKARRRLELELEKIRSEASAARLEARAAEIEMMIQGLEPTTRIDPPIAGVRSPGGDSQIAAQTRQPAGTSPPSRIASWDQLRNRDNVIGVTGAAAAVSPRPDSASTSSASSTLVAASPQPILRTDAAESAVRRPRMLDFESTPVDDPPESAAPDEVIGCEDANTDESVTSPDLAPVTDPVAVFDLDDQHREPQPFVGEVAIDTLDDDELEDEPARRRPGALLFSAIAHVAAIILLAAISIQVHRPKDQVSLAGSAVEANEVSMETFEMESSEPESEQAEPTPSAVEYELSPVGELESAEFSPDTPPAPPSPAAEMMKSTASQSSAAMSLKSDSKAKIQFCGVEGGGNHFVYLVDCSKSMKEGFHSARMELLSSIEALSPSQRFYVVFFDAKPDYMRLSDANVDEPRSVDATPDNKRALKQWAMRVSMDRGRAPYEPLRFALQLKPDVIFLLSDGEFPQSIEDLLVEENRVDNLFGESSPISIVHTISYHSQEGETRMRRIAEQHGGQYRHVPKP